MRVNSSMKKVDANCLTLFASKLDHPYSRREDIMRKYNLKKEGWCIFINAGLDARLSGGI